MAKRKGEKHSKGSGSNVPPKKRSELQRKHAVMAATDSNLLRLLLLANKGLNPDGRLVFTPNKMYIKNVDAAVSQLAYSCLRRSAFSHYHCCGEEVLIDVSLKLLISETSRMTGKKVQSVITVPHSQREDGLYSSLSMYFQRSEGLQETATLQVQALDLKMEILDPEKLDWDFTFCLQQADFRRSIDQLCTDRMADRIKLTLKSSRIEMENDNADPMCRKHIALKTSELIEYKRKGESEECQSIILSRPKLQSMLSLPGTGDFLLTLQGTARMVCVEYELPEHVGFIRFFLCTMVSENV